MKHHKMQSLMKQNKLDLKNKNRRCIENLYMGKKQHNDNINTKNKNL